MSVYGASMMRLKARGLLNETMIAKAVLLGRITEEEAQIIREV